MLLGNSLDKLVLAARVDLTSQLHSVRVHLNTDLMQRHLLRTNQCSTNLASDLQPTVLLLAARRTVLKGGVYILACQGNSPSPTSGKAPLPDPS